MCIAVAVADGSCECDDSAEDDGKGSNAHTSTDSGLNKTHENHYGSEDDDARLDVVGAAGILQVDADDADDADYGDGQGSHYKTVVYPFLLHWFLLAAAVQDVHHAHGWSVVRALGRDLGHVYRFHGHTHSDVGCSFQSSSGSVARHGSSETAAADDAGADANAEEEDDDTGVEDKIQLSICQNAVTMTDDVG